MLIGQKGAAHHGDKLDWKLYETYAIVLSTNILFLAKGSHIWIMWFDIADCPDVSISPSGGQVNVGQNFTCSATAYPPVTMILLSVNNTFIANESQSHYYTIDTVGDCIISCTAFNYIYGTSNPPCSSTTSVIVSATEICEYLHIIYDDYWSHWFACQKTNIVTDLIWALSLPLLNPVVFVLGCSACGFCIFVSHCSLTARNVRNGQALLQALCPAKYLLRTTTFPHGNTWLLILLPQ